MNARPRSQPFSDCQQIRARIDGLADEIAWLTAALDIQFKRTTDTRARLRIANRLFPAIEPQGRALRGAATAAAA